MTTSQALYQLLPVIHRMRDAERGEPLRGLLDIVEGEVRRLIDDIDSLYDNWFIETCDDWVVPYLGDLLGVPLSDGIAGQRAFVADTLRLRRRKGTPVGLEQLARDITGWPAHVVEYFQLLATTQHVDYVRPAPGGTVDLRDGSQLDLLASPFSEVARTADVRHIDRGRGRYNIPSIGLHLWRLASYPIEGGDARAVDAAHGRWSFDPSGHDVPLVNRPRARIEPNDLSREADVPGLLSRRLLERLLGTEEGATDEGATGELDEVRCPPFPRPQPDRPTGAVVRVWWDGAASPIVHSCDLTTWTRPNGGPGGPVSVDPVLGRLTLPVGVQPARVRVDYAYGFPGDLGAGPWDRRSLTTAVTADWPEPHWQVAVAAHPVSGPGAVVRSLGEAASLWRSRPAGAERTGVIAITDSASYHGDVTIQLSAGERLLIVAAGWPAESDDASEPAWRPGLFDAAGLRPHLIGSIRVLARGGAGSGAELVLSGLSVEGRVVVRPGGLTRLVLAGCTLRPSDTSADAATLIAADNPDLTVELERTVGGCTGLRRIGAVRAVDSVLSAREPASSLSLDAPDSRVEINNATLLGRTTAGSLTTSNAILLGRVSVRRQQLGLVRYSFLPPDSIAPRRYRCQPEPGSATPVEPRFSSLDLDDPRFGQLHEQCPVEITAGADDEGEMGAYHFLQQRRRVGSLAAQLNNYLPFGLEAGVFFTT